MMIDKTNILYSPQVWQEVRCKNQFFTFRRLTTEVTQAASSCKIINAHIATVTYYFNIVGEWI